MFGCGWRPVTRTCGRVLMGWRYCACACCGSTRLAKLGEDVTETLETIPRQWKVVQYVREKFTCRECERISQAPAPFHVLPRGFAGPSLLAMILFEKYGQHQPLNWQSERYARAEGAFRSDLRILAATIPHVTRLPKLFSLVHVLRHWANLPPQ